MMCYLLLCIIQGISAHLRGEPKVSKFYNEHAKRFNRVGIVFGILFLIITICFYVVAGIMYGKAVQAQQIQNMQATQQLSQNFQSLIDSIAAARG